MSVVIDASTCVAALTDTSKAGLWAEKILSSPTLSAPQLILIECSNILRRLNNSGKLDDNEVSAAYRDLLLLNIDLYPFNPLASRIWALRHNLTSYDAWHVALAESLDCPMATLDNRMTNAAGPLCKFLLLESS